VSLHSRKKINRFTWTELPTPDQVIAQIHWLAIAAEKYDGIILTDVNGIVLSEKFTDDTDEENNAESGIFIKHQPPETTALEEEIESKADMMRPEMDDVIHMPDYTENQDNTQEEAIEHKEEEMSKERVTIDNK
jgi:hypothetical protein